MQQRQQVPSFSNLKEEPAIFFKGSDTKYFRFAGHVSVTTAQLCPFSVKTTYVCFNKTLFISIIIPQNSLPTPVVKIAKVYFMFVFHIHICHGLGKGSAHIAIIVNPGPSLDGGAFK